MNKKLENDARILWNIVMQASIDSFNGLDEKYEKGIKKFKNKLERTIEKHAKPTCKIMPENY